MTWMGVALSIVAGVSVAMGAGKKPAADVEPASETTFSGATMLVTTNAGGNVVQATIATTSATYGLLTNGIPVAVLKDWLRFNDRIVDVKGEVSQGAVGLCIKVVGTIRDVTPLLRGGTLTVRVNDKKEITQVTFAVPDRQLNYGVATNGLPDATIKGLPKLNGMVVDIDGKISPSRGIITDVKSIRPGKVSKKKGK